MGRGRKPLPTQIKKLKGTLEKSRVLDDEMTPEPVSEIPLPPEWLNDIARQEWYRVVGGLAALKMVSSLDLGMLAIYCNEMSVYIEIEEMLRQKDRVMVFKHENGQLKYAQVVPYQKVADRAFEKAMKIATEFGFTPASRTRISTGQAKLPGEVSNDPLDELM